MSDLKQIAREIFQRTLSSIDIPATLERKLDRSGSRIRCGDAQIDLKEYERIVTIAFGKAAYAMASGLRCVLEPDFATGGILVVPSAPPSPLPRFETFLAGHPVPTPASLAAAGAILKLLATCDEKALVFFLISGGASALVEKPLYPDVSLEDVQALNRTLVTCGAPIDEINAVRKHLSAVKGGRMAAAAPRAMKITLGVSDVPEGRESALGSGPTLPDPTTVQDALRVIQNYELTEKLPASVRAKFDPRGPIPETPKAGEPAFARAHFQLLLGMHDLFHHAHQWAETAGCVTICDNATDDWPLQQAADFLLDQLAQLKAANPTRSVAVIADGELSSPVTGDGVGGRNSAFALECVKKIAGKPIAVLSAGTDGVDGNSPAAGAVADGQTLDRARAAGLDPRHFFRRSDAYSFFKRLGDTIETGPTGNNLRDLRILLSK